MRLLAMLFTTFGLVATSANAEEIKVFAAGSLKAAMGDLAKAFQAQNTQATIKTEFGASGLLRERIEKGEAAHVFASADTGHPKALVDAGKTDGPPVIFARNQLCALAKEGLAVTPDTLVGVLLDPAVRVGMSTPKADPSGDYALVLFAKAEMVQPGVKAALEAKAVQLTGGPQSEKAPEGRNLYAWVMSSGKADVFLTYCTNALVAKDEAPSLQIVAIPAVLAVGADYGLVVLKDSPVTATEFARFVVSAEGRRILQRWGFGPAPLTEPAVRRP